ncbi:MotA/TolQ/ExbB proton channel family protein [Marinobacter panjinensis]|uniref:MotA/TolQ/ExbB proton channel family protein n=1 Tax=Marinobacter panjinensis TaxID=2576384 RepID=A0A4U6R0K7_9GAMM|nr:MotA/TolQ/ExbB proton channel family protein [Marinobacter panjinensis]TKV66980.1 MotA/TolQ/ExbB proton channel family protein [Marinobacter panjinensis]
MSDERWQSTVFVSDIPLGRFAISVAIIVLAYILSVGLFWLSPGPDIGDALPDIDSCTTRSTIEDFKILTTCQIDEPAKVSSIIYIDRGVPLVTINSVRKETSLTLEWEYAFNLFSGLDRTFGPRAWQGSSNIVRYLEGPWWAPTSWETVYDSPIGAISPRIKQILQRAIFVYDDNIKDGVRDLIANRVVTDISRSINMEKVDRNAKKLALYRGPVQFVTLWIFLITLCLMLLGTRYREYRESADIVVPLILYVGFFGTLLGMSGGLGILGDADLTDDLSKGIRLGPIGSQIGLALNTTLYAVSLFLLASLMDFLLRHVFPDASTSS